MTLRTASARTLGALFFALSLASPLAAPLAAQSPTPRGPKIFISVDMEGLAGVVNNSDVSASGPDYQMFRTIMAGETNAAIARWSRKSATCSGRSARWR